jgi:hypothetical protein
MKGSKIGNTVMTKKYVRGLTICLKIVEIPTRFYIITNSAQFVGSERRK